jgi:hypothetical protein
MPRGSEHSRHVRAALLALTRTLGVFLGGGAARACEVRSVQFNVESTTFDPAAIAGQSVLATLNVDVGSTSGCVLQARLVDVIDSPLRPFSAGGVQVTPDRDLTVGSGDASSPQYAWVWAPPGQQTLTLRWRMVLSRTSIAMPPAGSSRIETRVRWAVRESDRRAPLNYGDLRAFDAQTASWSWTLFVPPKLDVAFTPACGNASATTLNIDLRGAARTCVALAITGNIDATIAVSSANGGKLIHDADASAHATYAADLVAPNGASDRLFAGPTGTGVVTRPARLADWGGGPGRLDFQVLDASRSQLAGAYSDVVTVTVSGP